VPSVEDIVGMLLERKQAQSPLLHNMARLRDAYNGDIVVPLPEMDRQEQAAVANLISTGLDQSAMRISSVMPNLYFPPVKPGDRASEKRSYTRRDATLGWWEANKMPLKLRRRARHMIGYASSPVVLRPDRKRGIARWELRSPLSTYAAPTEDPDDITPLDCIFTFGRSYKWLQTNYPDRIAKLNTNGKAPSPHEIFEVVEYVDGEVTVMAVIGSKSDPHAQYMQGSAYVELERVVNRTGICPAVVPGRITLDRPMGQFDGLVGMYQMQAKLMALEVIAVERGIFPDTYLISRPGESAKFISGPFDGRTGMVNVVAGGDLKEAGQAQGTASGALIDRLERSMRITSGTPAEFGGESTTNIRTGKRGDAILSAVVDFPVQEAQEILAASMQEENKRAIAIAKTYFGEQRRSFYVSRNAKHVDYIPNKDFETDENSVNYSYAGADANALVVGLGQRIGIGTMSKRTAQEVDPLIADPEREHDRVIQEQLEQALLLSVQQQAQAGTIPPADLAKIMNMILTDKLPLAEAIEKVNKLAQERQATAAPMGSPETQPGLGAPGMGMEQPGSLPPATEGATAGPAATGGGAAPAGPPDLQSLLAQLGAGA
jgi:hypothetical protein